MIPGSKTDDADILLFTKCSDCGAIVSMDDGSRFVIKKRNGPIQVHIVVYLCVNCRRKNIEQMLTLRSVPRHDDTSTPVAVSDENAHSDNNCDLKDD